jgi:acetylornithine deacetylase
MSPFEMLEQLIRFNTVSRESNLQLIEFVEEYLHEHGFESTRVPSDDGRKSNLYATVGPQEAGGVVLSGHTDVVPVDGQAWDTDPFCMTPGDGLFYGRGTCDMKAFLGIGLALVPEMKRLKKPIHFALSYDEEVGCLGAPRMVRQIAERLPPLHAVIIGEPTSMGAVNGNKGMVGLRTTVGGYETHSSQTNRGVSAVMTAARLVTHLNEMAERLSRETSVDNGFDPHHTSIHVGVISGGTALNIISRHCEFVWDIRNIPDDDPTRLIDEFEYFCQNEVLPGMRARHKDCFIKTESLAQVPALVPVDSPALTLVQMLSGSNEVRQVAYGTEAGQFQEAQFPTVICGPGSIDQAHQPNEFISHQQLQAGEAFIRRLIDRLSS